MKLNPARVFALSAALIGAVFFCSPASAQIVTPASNAVIYDYDSGEVLYCKNCEEPMPPSSMSKLMTVELVFQRLKDGRLKLSDKFHVSEKAWRQGLQTNESKMFVEVNTDVSVDNLLKGIIVQSGGDACVVVAEALGGSEAGFAKMENERAKQIGLEHSHFVNSSGLPDPGQYMSALDIAKLSAHIVRDYPEYYPYFSIESFTWSKITQANRNRLLFENIGVDGIKTGHTEAGGYGMVSSALRNGRRIIVVVNGLNSDGERTSESRRLLDIGFRDFRRYALLKADATVGEAPVWGGTQPVVPLKIKDPLTVTMDVASRPSLKVTLRYTGPVPAPIAEGQEIGRLTVLVPDKPDTSVPVFAARAVGQAGIVGKIMLGLHALIKNGAS